MSNDRRAVAGRLVPLRLRHLFKVMAVSQVTRLTGPGGGRSG